MSERTPEESLDGLILEADWQDMHGGDHHDDNCEVCRDIANVRSAILNAAATPSDPLVGLDERLDRLLLTASDNNRFVLSTESAQNIVGIVREWLRAKSKVPAPCFDNTASEALEAVGMFFRVLRGDSQLLRKGYTLEVTKADYDKARAGYDELRAMVSRPHGGCDSEG